MKAKAPGFIQKVTDKHHRIERFGVMAIVCAVILGICTGSIAVKHHKDTHQMLSNQAVYTTDFTMSRSGTTGHVVDVFVNQSKTNALVLLKFDDMSRMSIDANNYYIFLRGCTNDGKPLPLEYNPSCALYVFGTTGYVGLQMVDKSGFPNQITYMTMRNDKELTTAQEINPDELTNAQYAELDLCDIFFNVGANDATVVSCLDNDVVTVRDMYEECVARSREAQIKARLEQDLADMRIDLALISEYSQRLTNLDIALNSPYPVIAGDYIVNKDGVAVGSMDYTAQLADYTEGEHLRLISSSVCSGGVDFDWYNGSVHEGYINGLKGDMTPQEYVNSLMSHQEGESGDDTTTQSDWYFKSSGAKFVFAQGQFTQAASDIQNAITGLEGAWNSYYTHKLAYETVDLIELLALDYEVMSVDNNFTVNNSQNSFSITK